MGAALQHWVDAHGWIYWAGGFGALALLLATVGLALPSAEEHRLRRLGRTPLLFALALALAFSAFRWPAFFAGIMDNPDEAQWLAAAITYREGGLPWRNVDLHTSGPLTPYALLLTRPLGLPLDYLGARVLATLFQIAALLAFYATTRRFVPDWIARLALVPAIPFWALPAFHDLLQYSSEHAPVLLLALGIWVATAALGRPAGSRPLVALFAGGALLGAACFAKPQALPLQGASLLLLVGAIWRSDPSFGDIADRRRRTIALLAGAVAPAAAFVAYISAFGLWGQIRQFLWDTNVHYATQREYPWSGAPEAFLRFAGTAPGVTAGLLGTLAFCVATATTVWNADRGQRPRLLGGWLLLGAALVATITPGRLFCHYVHLVVLPLCWCAAVHLDAWHRRRDRTSHPTGGRCAQLAATFAATVVLWPLGQRLGQPRPITGPFTGWEERQSTAIGTRLKAEARPGDRLVVWGWAPEYHVETGLPQGAREAHGAFLLAAGPLQQRYRWRFLFDLRRNRPRWFIDSVKWGAFAYQDRRDYGHDAWPELRELVANDYELLACLDGVYLYRRKD